MQAGAGVVKQGAGAFAANMRNRIAHAGTQRSERRPKKTHKFQTFPLYKMQKIHLNAKEYLHFAPDRATMQITKAIA